jgi:2-methylcitrate dehydratase PrpD
MSATATQTLAEALATFAVGFDLRTSPDREALLERARIHILDGIGVAMASSIAEDGFAGKLLKVVHAFGTAPECTIVGYPDRAAAPFAAFMNGSLIHGCEFDDAFMERMLHSESFAVPVALALAEQRGLDGWAMVEGWLIATELALRASLGCKTTSLNACGFHNTAIFGTIGAAAGAARLLGLHASQVADAISLAVSFTSGTNEGWSLKSGRNKSIQPGWSAQAGIMAAQMAAAGYACSHATLDGPRGLYASHSWKYGWDPAPVLDGIGSTWKTPDLVFKVYPAGAWSQTLIDCTRELVNENDIKPDEVERVEVTMPAQYADNFTNGRVERMYRPDTGYAMHGSWPCAVARMVLSRAIGLQHLTNESAHDPELLAMADRVTCRPGTDTDTPPGLRPTSVVIHTPRGRFERTRISSTGYPDAISRQYIVDKFRLNARLVMAEPTIDAIVELVLGLDQLADVRKLTERLRVER